MSDKIEKEKKDGKSD